MGMFEMLKLLCRTFVLHSLTCRINKVTIFAILLWLIGEEYGKTTEKETSQRIIRRKSS
jgi:hypothetical protein